MLSFLLIPPLFALFPMFRSRVPLQHGAWLLAALGWAATLLPDAAVAQGVPAAAAEATSAEPAFDVLEYVIEGNTVLAVEQVELAVMPFLGPGLNMARVEAARAALEKTYQDAGYLSVFVDVPEQRIDSGVVMLKVLEGRVERLRVTNSRYFSQGYIREQVPELAEGRVPNFNVLQEQLARVNRTEDRRVQPLLRPGKTPGTVESELKVTDRLPLGASVDLNNRHAAGSAPLRASATVRYDNLFQRDHSVSVTAITAPADPKQSRVLTANYSVPLSSGATLAGYAVLSDSFAEPLGAATVFGKGVTLGVRYALPLPPLADYSHSVTFGVDYKDTRQRVLSSGDELSTPVRYLPLSLAYSGSWLQGPVSTSLNASGVFALARLLQRDVLCAGFVIDQFECTRQGADGGFSTLRAEVRQDRPLVADWKLGVRLAGMVSTQPLISGEQFVAGGADSVRGYYEAEAAGDRGWLTSFEVSSPNFAPAPTEGARFALTDLTAVGFIDAARAYLYRPGIGQAPRVALIGTGVGLRMRAGRAASLRLDLGWPLKATVSTARNDPRLTFGLGLTY